MSEDREQMMFHCPDHHFVVNASSDGEVSSRGTPAHRVTGCFACDKAVSDAFDFAAGIED